MTKDAPSEAIYKQVLETLDDLKAKEISEMDLVGKADFADKMIVASGTSSRHVKALAEEVRESVKKRLNIAPLGIEGLESGEWVLVDYGHLIVHIMQPATRDFYELERLWTARPQKESSGP